MNSNSNDNDFFGSFRTLTPAQIKGNAIFLASHAAGFFIMIVGVVAAVLTKKLWLAPTIGLIGIIVYFFVAGKRNIRYVTKFGMKYNIMRSLICGFLIYGAVGWKGLLGIFHYLIWEKEWDISITSFGWTVLAISLLITFVTKLSLYRTEDVQVADLIGLIEMLSLAIFISSIMFLLLYT